MRRIIHYIRQKPEHHRNRIAIGLSAFITALIFIVWVSFIRLQYMPKENDGGQMAKSLEPVLVLKQNMATIYKSINFDFSTILKIFGDDEETNRQ